MKRTYDVFIKCTNKIILLVAGEDVRSGARVICVSVSVEYWWNTGMLFPPQTI